MKSCVLFLAFLSACQAAKMPWDISDPAEMQQAEKVIAFVGNFFESKNLPAPWMTLPNMQKHRRLGMHSVPDLPAACKEACPGAQEAAQSMADDLMAKMMEKDANGETMIVSLQKMGNMATMSEEEKKKAAEDLGKAMGALFDVVFEYMCSHRESFSCVDQNKDKCDVEEDSEEGLTDGLSSSMGPMLSCMCGPCSSSMDTMKEMMVGAITGQLTGSESPGAENAVEMMCSLMPAFKCFESNEEVCMNAIKTMSGGEQMPSTAQMESMCADGASHDGKEPSELCKECLTKFDAAGGCACMKKEGCDPAGMIPTDPEGCGQCAAHADNFCGAGPEASPSPAPSTTPAPKVNKHTGSVAASMSAEHAQALTKDLPKAKEIFKAGIVKSGNFDPTEVTVTTIYVDGEALLDGSRRLADSEVKADFEVTTTKPATALKAATPEALTASIEEAAKAEGIPVTVTKLTPPTVNTLSVPAPTPAPVASVDVSDAAGPVTGMLWAMMTASGLVWTM